jgi:ACS family glucarate transporter-like MFS transporter
MVGFALGAIGLFASVFAHEALIAVGCLSLAILGADMTLSPSWSSCIDIGRGGAGAVSGTMNMAGNLGAFATALAFPYLREWSDSTAPFFVVGGGLNLIAFGLWSQIRPDQPLEAG